ncbi:541_t:CDS:2, partial [Dentiscutata erythropus]
SLRAEFPGPLITISSGSVVKSKMANGYMMQANEIMNSALETHNKKDEETSYTINIKDDDAISDSNQVYGDNKFTENNLKRKLDDDGELPGYDGLVFLFNDSNEDMILKKIDKNKHK